MLSKQQTIRKKYKYIVKSHDFDGERMELKGPT